ncbi:hypothetical protein C4J95_0159 [Pseudomonas orientalis]|uniref:hypothetical protein n=1 Tax=Pseudomonas orientalis TaxID=76758 RepID=UPI000F6C22E7|nr:hypothetical protein [Pseudomonas orientalis]AZE92311.1 hypothetical protein C4J96_0160 [Pseudomonas orientalis]AZE92312.1 hypothetical protein C4J96_0161 [Pseudomonas orientalis]AZE97654.1 hypothetical protein C4J95_0159 [Pseudomonas orientalis]
MAKNRCQPVGGVTAPKAVEQQSQMAAERVSGVAVEQFISFVMSKAGAMGGAQ